MTRLHHVLDDRPISFWLRGLGVIVFLSFSLSGYAVIKQSQAAAAVTADKKAQAVTQVGQCFQSRRSAPGVLAALELIDVLADNSVKSNQEALDQAEPGDPLTPVRLASLKRVLPAQEDLRQLIASTKKLVPSKAKCNELARTLGVNPSKLNGP